MRAARRPAPHAGISSRSVRPERALRALTATLTVRPTALRNVSKPLSGKCPPTPPTESTTVVGRRSNDSACTRSRQPAYEGYEASRSARAVGGLACAEDTALGPCAPAWRRRQLTRPDGIDRAGETRCPRK